MMDYMCWFICDLWQVSGPVMGLAERLEMRKMSGKISGGRDE